MRIAVVLLGLLAVSGVVLSLRALPRAPFRPAV